MAILPEPNASAKLRFPGRYRKVNCLCHDVSGYHQQMFQESACLLLGYPKPILSCSNTEARSFGPTNAANAKRKYDSTTSKSNYRDRTDHKGSISHLNSALLIPLLTKEGLGRCICKGEDLLRMLYFLTLWSRNPTAVIS